MDFISWSVFGALFILAESAIGNRYLLAIGLAFSYPVIADLMGASGNIQVTVLSAGLVIHTLVVFFLRKGKSTSTKSDTPSDIGQRVEVIEWLGEGTARVMYHGKEWSADKARIEMPDADHAIIKGVQYGRLIITTTPNAPEERPVHA